MSNTKKHRITCEKCIYYDFNDSQSSSMNNHPNKASWSHLCKAKNIQKYSNDTACKTYFLEK